MSGFIRCAVAALLAVQISSSTLLGLGCRPAFAAARAPARDSLGMVATPTVEASRAGASMLAAGGNAIDAAIAAAFALAVSEPYHGGIGGGGFLLIRLADGRVVALDGREVAPAAARREMYVAAGVPEDAARVGGLAVGVPGLVAALCAALETYGTKSLTEVLAPAIALAEEGVTIGPRHAEALARWRARDLAARFPETARIQLPPAGNGKALGWRLRQADLAGTLRDIAREGRSAIYQGKIAQQIVGEVRRHGGILSLDDLARYAPKQRASVRGSYRGVDIHSFPPPSSGGVALIEMLNILEGFDLSSLGAGSSASIHLAAEAMKLAFADRAAYIGDPDFIPVPVQWLTSKSYAETLRSRIRPPWYRKAPWAWGRPERAIRVSGPGAPPDDGGTSHLSVIDAQGNAVSLTQTINGLFGSGITVRGTGIILNNEMADFQTLPHQTRAGDERAAVWGVNSVAPGKRPLSSMTPTIALRGGKPLLVAGSPGGPMIITTTLLTILNVLDHDMDAQEAVSAPRFHHQWRPDQISVEPEIPRDVIEALRRRGHRVKRSERRWSSAQLIVVDQETGTFSGGSDPRSDGIPIGPQGLLSDSPPIPLSLETSRRPEVEARTRESRLGIE